MADNTPILKLIPVNRILPSRHQARKNFDEEGLKGLAESIQKEGLLEPVMVRAIPAPQGSDGEWYELVYGERRFRACKLLGRDTIEAIITTVASEAASAAKGLVENLQREGINPIEEAEGFAHLNQLDPGYWTQEQIAGVVGRSRGYIAQSLGILQLTQSVKDSVSRLTLSRSHALDLMRLPSADLQVKVAEQIVAQDMNRENARALIEKMLGHEPQGSMAGAEQQGGKTGPKAQPAGFRFNKVGKDIHIIGIFPGTVTLPDLSKWLDEAYQKFQAQPPKAKWKRSKNASNGGIASPAVRNDVIARNKVTKQSGLLNIDDLIKIGETMLKGGPGAFGGIMAAQLEASLALMNQRLADPNVSEAEKTQLKEGIQKLQEKLAEIKKK